MKKTSIELITTILETDDTVSPEPAESILRCCRQSAVRRKLIGAKEVMAYLQISRPTLRSYVKNGLLHQINLSTRKVRFDEEEVLRIADFFLSPPKEVSFDHVQTI